MMFLIKEFNTWVTPVIKNNKRGCYVQIVAKHKDGNEITTGLISYELRELADYLDSKEKELKKVMNDEG